MAKLEPGDNNKKIFLEGLKIHGLDPIGGAASLTSLSQAFATMKSRLAGGAAEQVTAFAAAIDRAIEEEPSLPVEQRDAARGVLRSAFDGMVRESPVKVVKCNFLNRVRFD